VDAWRRTLLGIPTLFGRLVYLASLRDPSSGIYRHEALEALLGEDECDRALSRRHRRLFSDWLAHSVEEQRADLEEYLRASGAHQDLRQFHRLIPSAARDVERQLFLADLETLAELLQLKARGAAG